MELVWAVPALACVAGAVVALLGFRALGDNAAELRVQFERLDEVRVAIAELRASTSETRTAVTRLRERR